MRYPFQNPVRHHHHLLLLLLLLTTTLLLFIIPPTLAVPPSSGTDPRLNDNHPTSSNTDNTNTNTPQVQGTTPNPLLPDPCGPPEHQDLHAKPASQSTCNRRIGRGWEGGDPFRLSCTQDATGYTIDWGSCTASVGTACVVLEYLGKQGPVGAGRERWVWPVAPIGECFFFFGDIFSSVCRVGGVRLGWAGVVASFWIY